MFSKLILKRSLGFKSNFSVAAICKWIKDIYVAVCVYVRACVYVCVRTGGTD